jgi:hypothetical protein
MLLLKIPTSFYVENVYFTPKIICISKLFSVVYHGLATNKTDRHDITEILLKVALNTINQTETIFSR